MNKEKKVIENPYKKASKSYRIHNLLIEGMKPKDIAAKVKVSQSMISRVNKQLKTLKQEAEFNHRNLSPENRTSAPMMVPPRVGEREGTTVQIEGFAPGKQVFLTANNILLYQWFVAKYGYDGDISDFINDAIEDFFKARDWKVMIVKGEAFV